MHFKLPISETLQALLQQEDTDADNKITIEDKGPKHFKLKCVRGNIYEVKGTYHLSNLLQELALERQLGKTTAEIPVEKIEELPSYRISRMIRDYFWNDLTRTIDKKGLHRILGDEKIQDTIQRIYVPEKDLEGIKYYKALKKELPALEIQILPEQITPTYVKSINKKPGLLALALQDGSGVPFVVPGGRFNEMYGWDSYFESVGLLIDNRLDLAMAMADNFAYQIRYYGKILNANRSYFLTRTQPPFFSSLLKEIYQYDPEVSKDWMSRNLKMVIKEYEKVWMQKGVRLTETGLNRFLGEGIGIPPETEEGHFNFVLQRFAKKHGLSLEAFIQAYDGGTLKDPELDAYFMHDRSLRESGHDTSNRLDDICANLNTVGLNSLLYKYEMDIAYLIENIFNDSLEGYNSAFWLDKANKRKALVNKYLWNDKEGSFYDYNFVSKEPHLVDSATNFYPLWAGLCNEEQAGKLVSKLFDRLVQNGGVAGTSNITEIEHNAPQRQWDYPNGWAPHQMVIWRGLQSYGYEREAQELVYRWLWMITKNAVNYNGTIPEKYDVVGCTHKVYAEYGNVGTQFDYITSSGFGWMNASYQLGLSILNKEFRMQLDQLVNPDDIFSKQT
ncbi:alpha,alpha-trehalase [Aquimarina spongiae]|uniref:Alpha,alpha-trehalase n=1 Tax=Aquimarina spongiae TaxID=570521 RepID=A0A1M6E9E7_9FLAO|nr:alpha,alpha-trehalase [Aquimarina spongiae]SHI82061.1 alpha,alpha-trehalase [Aquimarina spongiae]